EVEGVVDNGLEDIHVARPQPQEGRAVGLAEVGNEVAPELIDERLAGIGRVARVLRPIPDDTADLFFGLLPEVPLPRVAFVAYGIDVFRFVVLVLLRGRRHPTRLTAGGEVAASTASTAGAWADTYSSTYSRIRHYGLISSGK